MQGVGTLRRRPERRASNGCDPWGPRGGVAKKDARRRPDRRNSCRTCLDRISPRVEPGRIGARLLQHKSAKLRTDRRRDPVLPADFVSSSWRRGGAAEGRVIADALRRGTPIALRLGPSTSGSTSKGCSRPALENMAGERGEDPRGSHGREHGRSSRRIAGAPDQAAYWRRTARLQGRAARSNPPTARDRASRRGPTSSHRAVRRLREPDPAPVKRRSGDSDVPVGMPFRPRGDAGGRRRWQAGVPQGARTHDGHETKALSRVPAQALETGVSAIDSRADHRTGPAHAAVSRSGVERPDLWLSSVPGRRDRCVICLG